VQHRMTWWQLGCVDDYWTSGPKHIKSVVIGSPRVAHGKRAMVGAFAKWCSAISDPAGRTR